MRAIPRQTKVLTIGVFLVMTGLTLVAPILPLYAREFGVTRTAAGGLISAFALARLVFDVGGGIASDRLGAKRVMLAGAVVLSLASVGAALAPNYGILLATRVLEGFGSAAFATAAMKLVIVTTDKDRLGRTMAFYQTGLLAGISVGPVLGGFAAEIGDFTTPFWLYAVLGALIAAGIWRYVEEPDTPITAVRDVYRAAGTLLRRPAFIALLVVAFVIFVMRAGARITLLPLYAGEALGFRESEIGLVIAAAALVNLAVVNPGGWLVDKVGRIPVLVAGLLAAALAITAHGWVTTFGSLLLLSAGFGVAAALLGIPPPTLAGDLAPPGAEGAAVGLYRTAADLGLVVGPLLVGWLAEGGAFDTAFAVVGLMLAGAAVVALAIGETRHRAGAEVGAGVDARLLD